MRADREFIEHWRGRYFSESKPSQIEEEEVLLRRVGPAIRERGYYTVGELQQVNKWKLPTERNRSWLAKNSHHRVRAVTERALAAPEPLQLYVLQSHERSKRLTGPVSFLTNCSGDSAHPTTTGGCRLTRRTSTRADD